MEHLHVAGGLPLRREGPDLSQPGGSSRRRVRGRPRRLRLHRQLRVDGHQLGHADQRHRGRADHRYARPGDHLPQGRQRPLHPVHREVGERRKVRIHLRRGQGHERPHEGPQLRRQARRSGCERREGRAAERVGRAGEPRGSGGHPGEDGLHLFAADVGEGRPEDRCGHPRPVRLRAGDHRRGRGLGRLRVHHRVRLLQQPGLLHVLHADPGQVPPALHLPEAVRELRADHQAHRCHRGPGHQRQGR